MSVRTSLEYARGAEWAPWDQYTATWSSASNPQPAIGNGTLVAAFRRVGVTGYLRGALTMGSSTTKGTGEWRISMPSGWTASSNLTNGWQFGFGMYFGAATTPGHCYVSPGATVLTFVYSGPLLSVTSSAPFTWSTNHFMTWQIVLELAS